MAEEQKSLSTRFYRKQWSKKGISKLSQALSWPEHVPCASHILTHHNGNCFQMYFKEAHIEFMVACRTYRLHAADAIYKMFFLVDCKFICIMKLFKTEEIQYLLSYSINYHPIWYFSVSGLKKTKNSNTMLTKWHVIKWDCICKKAL